jgi:hypothetical protein
MEREISCPWGRRRKSERRDAAESLLAMFLQDATTTSKLAVEVDSTFDVIGSFIAGSMPILGLRLGP